MKILIVGDRISDRGLIEIASIANKHGAEMVVEEDDKKIPESLLEMAIVCSRERQDRSFDIEGLPIREKVLHPWSRSKKR